MKIRGQITSVHEYTYTCMLYTFMDQYTHTYAQTRTGCDI